jgi:hypothetical protein
VTPPLLTRVKSRLWSHQTADDHDIVLAADALCRSVDAEVPQSVAEKIVAEMSPLERQVLINGWLQ